MSFFALGWSRADIHEASMIDIQKLYGQKIMATGTIADDPTVNQRGFLVFNLDLTSINNQPANGAVSVRTYNQKLRRGYKVSVVSKFDATLGNKLGQLVYGTVTIQSSQLSTLEQWRQRYFAGMRNALPEPSASFALGLLLGPRGLIPKELQDVLTTVGLTHLIAVSGYNLTILINAARKPLRSVSKFLALMMPLWLIFVFMLLTGFSASIVRAAIVSGLSLLASYYGRTYKPMVLIMLSAVTTLAYNPAYLWSDVGWQLSFLAFYGILVIGPLMTTLLRAERMIPKLIIESTAAYIITLPLIMGLFGNISIISPVANVLILPLVPLVMFLAFVAGLFGMATPLAALLGIPLKLLLAAMLGLMEFLSKVPYASIIIPPTTSAFLLYIPIMVCTGIMYLQVRRRSFMI
jgi:competence protein ComEC